MQPTTGQIRPICSYIIYGRVGQLQQRQNLVGKQAIYWPFQTGLMVGMWAYKQLNAKKCCTVLINAQPIQRNQREPLGLGRRRMSVENIILMLRLER